MICDVASIEFSPLPLPSPELRHRPAAFTMEDSKLDAEIEALMNEEKQMRLAADVAGTKKGVTEVIQMCYEAKVWKSLNEQILLLSKRRSQLKTGCDCDGAVSYAVNE